MSFGLGRDRALDDAPGRVGITRDELGTLPDDLHRDPTAAWVDPREWFPDPAKPLELEIGSGKGTFLIQEAPRHADANFLGLECAREFYLYAADRVRRHGLANVRLLHADAGEFVRWRVPDGILRVIHLYFPDPWPKTRHHKNRIVQPRFMADCWRVLKPGGELRIVTDHDDYWRWIEDHAEACSSERAGRDGRPFERLAFEPTASAGEGEMVGSNFERKYRRDGRPFHAMILRKVTGSAG